MAFIPNYADVRWDGAVGSGKPYWLNSDGAKVYIPPMTAAQYQTNPDLQAWAKKQGTSIDYSKPDMPVTNNARPTGSFFENPGTWNSQTGGWDQGVNWGNIATLAAGGLMGAGALSAAGAFGAGAGSIATPAAGYGVLAPEAGTLAGAAGAGGAAAATGGTGILGVGGGAPTLALDAGAAGGAGGGGTMSSILGALGGGGGAYGWIGPAINAGTQIYGASMQAGTAKDVAAMQIAAANHAADLQSQSAAAALAFAKQQAEADYKNQEIARQANYGQWVPAQQRLSTLGQMIGMAPRTIPNYVPSQDPNFTGGAPMVTPGGTLNSAMAAAPAMRQPQGAPVSGGNPQDIFQSLTGGKPLNQAGLEALGPQLKAAGITLGNPNASGVRSKIILGDGTAVRVLNGDTSVASPTVWMVQPGTGGSAGASMPTSSLAAGNSYTAPYQPFAMTPSLQMPGTINSLLR